MASTGGGQQQRDDETRRQMLNLSVLANEWTDPSRPIPPGKDHVCSLLGVPTTTSADAALDAADKLFLLTGPGKAPPGMPAAIVTDAARMLLELTQPGVIAGIWASSSTGTGTAPPMSVALLVEYRLNDAARPCNLADDNPLAVLGFKFANDKEVEEAIAKLRATPPDAAFQDEIKQKSGALLSLLRGFSSAAANPSPDKTFIDGHIARVQGATTFLQTTPAAAATSIEARFNEVKTIRDPILHGDDPMRNVFMALGLPVGGPITQAQFNAAYDAKIGFVDDVEFLGCPNHAQATNIRNTLATWKTNFGDDTSPLTTATCEARLDAVRTTCLTKIMADMNDIQGNITRASGPYAELQYFGFNEPTSVEANHVVAAHKQYTTFLDNPVVQGVYGAGVCAALRAKLDAAFQNVVNHVPDPANPLGPPIPERTPNGTPEGAAVYHRDFRRGGVKFEAHMASVLSTVGVERDKLFDRFGSAVENKAWYDKEAFIIAATRIGAAVVLTATATVLFVGFTQGMPGIEHLFGALGGAVAATFLGTSLGAAGGLVGWLSNRFIKNEDKALGNQFRELSDQGLDVKEIPGRVRNLAFHQVYHAISWGDPRTDEVRREAIADHMLMAEAIFKRSSSDKSVDTAVPTDESKLVATAKVRWLELGIYGDDLRGTGQNGIPMEQVELETGLEVGVKEILEHDPDFLKVLENVDRRLIHGVPVRYIDNAMQALNDKETLALANVGNPAIPPFTPADAAWRTTLGEIRTELRDDAHSTQLLAESRRYTRHNYIPGDNVPVIGPVVGKVFDFIYQDKRNVCENEDNARSTQLYFLILAQEAQLQAAATPTDKAQIKNSLMLTEIQGVEKVYAGGTVVGGGKGMHIPEKRLYGKAPDVYILGKLLGFWGAIHDGKKAG